MLGSIPGFYRKEIAPYLRHEPKKPLHVQAREMLALFRAYRYPPYQYLTSGLYDRDCKADPMANLPPILVDRYVKTLNERRGEIFVGDKVLFRRTLALHGIPVVRELFRFDRSGAILGPDDDAVPPDAARAILRAHREAHGEPVFVKPVAGQFGRDTRLVPPEEFDSLLQTPQRDLLVQPRLRQHPALEALHPASVNTVRIATLWTGQRWVHDAAVLRIGVGGEVVDNGARGGFIVGLDLATGELRPTGRQRAQFGTKRHDRHPDTGVVFAGIRVPHWSALLETVTAAAEILREHGLRSLGWDVCVTPDGVVLIEANAGWNVNLLQIGADGLRDTEIGQSTLHHYGLRNGAGRRPSGLRGAPSASP